MPATIHLRPTAPVAERVILPGDPGRALALAQALLSEPKMCNHHRGLWGYTGLAADGAPLTIQSSGMGGPSAAIVACELAVLGARTIVRAGTCGALDDSLALGQLLVVTGALAADGTSRSLGAAGMVAGDPELLGALREVADERVRFGAVASSDLFYDLPEGAERAWRTAGALAVEMEAAALFAVAERRGLRAGCALIVSDAVDRRRVSDDELRDAELALGALVAAALARLERDGRAEPAPP